MKKMTSKWGHSIYLDEKEEAVRKMVRTISQARQPVEKGHLYDKGKQVINEGVQRLVCQGFPGHVGHRFEFVVDK